MNSNLNIGATTRCARIFAAIIPLICAGFLYSGNDAIAQDTPAPDGNLNGATVTIAQPLRGMVRISNGKIVYTGTGSPAAISTGSQITNVSITGGTDDIQVAGNNISITKCSSLPSINANECDNLTITGNTIVGNGFDGITMNGPGQNDVITGNKIICDGVKCKEGIHVLNGGSIKGFVCSYNEIVGASRHGIEAQCQFQGGVCSYNYIHGWHNNIGDNSDQLGKPKAQLNDVGDDHMAISWACGYSPYPPVANSIVSNNCVISHNVLIMDGTCAQPLTCGWSQNAGIELYGNNATVSDNYEWNCGCNEYYQTTGFVSKNNIFVGLQSPGAGGAWMGEGLPPTNPPTPSVAPAVSGDQSFALHAANAPAAPVAGPAALVAGTTQPATPATQPGATGASPAVPTTQPAKTVTHVITVYNDGSISSN